MICARLRMSWPNLSQTQGHQTMGATSFLFLKGLTLHTGRSMYCAPSLLQRQSQGIEKDAGIFYGLGVIKPEYISIADAHWIDKKYDLIFVGWMEPGQDFRNSIARSTDIILTTLDQGISLEAEFDGHGFQRVAWWRTPSWEDVNTELMNRYYTKIPDSRRIELAKMRGAHNLWYVYAKPQKIWSVKAALKRQLEKESPSNDRYDFESVLDECGYGYLQKLENPAMLEPMWQVQWN